MKIKLVAQHNVKGLNYDLILCEFTHPGMAISVARMMQKHAKVKMFMQVHENTNKLDIMGGLKIYTIGRFIEKYKK